MKNVGEVILKSLYELIFRMYEKEEVRKGAKGSKLVMIPKKTGANDCEDYTTVSLLSHAPKILARITNSRIRCRM